MYRKMLMIAIVILAPGAFASGPTKLVPAKNESLRFERTYTTDYLKNHPLQLVTMTSFQVSKKGKKLTGEWKATFRDITTDESFEAKATADCTKKSNLRVECYFGEREGGTLVVMAQNGGALLSIPAGHGVEFHQEDEEEPGRKISTEMLIGTDDDNNLFRLYPKKARR
jgi:hypothetical protein